MSEDTIIPSGGDPAAPPAGNPPAGGDPAAGGGAPQPGEWRTSLPDDIRAHTSLGRYGTVGDMASAYINLERRLGHQEDYIKKPDWNNENDRADYFASIGRPKGPEDYRFPAPPEGVSVDESFQARLAAAFHQQGLLPQQVDGIVNSIFASFQDDEKKYTDGVATSKSESEAQLRSEWGSNFQEHVALAQRAMRYVFDEKTTEMLAGVKLLDNPGFAKGLLKMGQMMAEGRIDLGDGGQFAGSPEAAVAEFATMKLDKDFMLALRDERNEGHKPALDKWREIIKRLPPKDAATAP